MISAVGKLDSPEKRAEWEKVVTCDLDAILSFVDFAEACMDGLESVKKNIVS